MLTVKLFNVTGPVLKNQCYLVHHNKQGLLIDPAWDAAQIHNYIQLHQIHIFGILLTHAHNDHTHLAGSFAGYYNCPAYMSETEITSSGFQLDDLQAFQHRDILFNTPFKVQALLTPGHTPGSACFLISDTEPSTVSFQTEVKRRQTHLFSGDTVFIEGVGGCYDLNSDPTALYHSVQLLKNTIPPDTYIWPGHSYGETPGKSLDYLLNNNIYFQLDKIEHFVKFRMRKIPSR